MCRWTLQIPCLLLTLAATAACQQAAPADEGEPDVTPNVSVTVAPVVRTTLRGYVTGAGTIAPESASAAGPPASATIASPVSGLLATIQCREGERMRQGATLFTLDSRVVDVTIERARQALAYAESVVRRQEQLGPGEATSQRAYQDALQQRMAAQADLDAAEVQRQFLTIKAPIDGTVMRVNATLGDAIDPTTVLAELVDLNRLVVNAAVRSVDIPMVAVGQRVDLLPGAAPGTPTSDTVSPGTTTTVTYIAPQVDSATDTVVVRARVPTASRLRPGQFVNVRILTDERPDQLAVPVDSILQGEKGPEIAIVDGGMAVRTPVTTGLTAQGLTQVSGDAVREGMSVVVQGAYGLPPRANITIIGR